MNRIAYKFLRIFLDLMVLCLAFWGAILLRFDGIPPEEYLKRLTFFCPYAMVLEYIGLVSFGVPRFSWRYFGLREALRVCFGIAAATAVLIILRYGVPFLPWKSGYLRYLQVPSGVILINCVLALISVIGLRIARRVAGERLDLSRFSSSNVPEENRIATILVGAGSAGAMVAKELTHRSDLGINPIAFLDDDAGKAGLSIQGVEVKGSIDQLEKIAAATNATQVLITIADAPGRLIRNVSSACDRLGLKLKIIPGISELVVDKVQITRIRDVTIDDLLRRQPVKLDQELIQKELTDSTALVTGAGGSIGSELCRQLCQTGVKRLVLVEQAENALYEIHRSLVRAFPNTAIEPCIADVCDRERLRAIFGRFHPDNVFHAAAHKHVPMMEWNPGEAIKNNVFGTKSVADTAREFNVRRFVMISTDKAVNPTSVMGATKRIAELYVQSMARGPGQTVFVAVRFGNVLGSAGSVIPLFKSQIREGGPVTVTHPEMRRYFMTIPEASQLVLQAGAMGQGGEIFVLDMGEPVYIKDLAEDLIRLSGLVPGQDISITYTGLRPGEKLFEELSLADENATRTGHSKIFIGKIHPRPPEEVARDLEKLGTAVFGDGESTPASLRRLIGEIVPEYSPLVPESPMDGLSEVQKAAAEN